MSFDSLLRHTVDVVRPVAVLEDGLPTYDGRGQPITTPTVVLAGYRCRIEPKSAADAREVQMLNQAGPVIATHTIYGWPADVLTSDRLECTDGRAFEVLSIDDAGGHGHHLEVQAKRVASPELAVPEIAIPS